MKKISTRKKNLNQHTTFLGCDDWELNYFRSKFRATPASFLKQVTLPPSQRAIGEKTTVLSVFITTPIDEALLKQFPNVKYIATRSTGYDHCESTLLKERGVKVANVPSYGENTVAEMAFALLLSMTRKIHPTYCRIQDGNCSRDDLRGIDLRGKTLGVVGAGRIGQHAIRMGLGFGMKVLAYDPKRNAQLAKELGFQYANLSSLVKKSDVLTVHAPYFPSTHHILNKKNLSQCKKGMYLINTARGELIETEALYRGIKNGSIAGAGLDVLEDEASVLKPSWKPANKQEARIAQMNAELIRHPNVLYTPHNAYNTTEAIQRIADTTIDNILSFLRQKPKNLVI
ncbi:MAG: hydroxyacid dehydrogenase [Candidatus Nomurabacteria bacterium]|nr:MAG: hydroxyacid dehydrogenase [Candidatus Nomurabacteria bacterium]